MTTPKDKIAILGGKGMLGTDLAALCTERGLDFSIHDLPDFDITNEKNLQEVIENAALIINCAAYTNVEEAETQTDLAHKINAEAVGKLGAFAKKTGAYVMHISTDFIFDGTSDTPYTETAPPNPISEYGKSKLAGEKLLIESGCRYCIIRLQWTYGTAGNNFITKILSWAKQNPVLKVVSDQIGSPTATKVVAKTICDLLPQKPEGIFHFASAGFVSRFGIAQFIFDQLNMTVDLKACKTSDFPSKAERPLSSRFDCTKITALLDEPIRHWQKPLENFLRQL